MSFVFAAATQTNVVSIAIASFNRLYGKRRRRVAAVIRRVKLKISVMIKLRNTIISKAPSCSGLHARGIFEI